MNENLALEQNILGIILYTNGIGPDVEKAMTILKRDHFYYQINKNIFSYMIAIFLNERPPNLSELDKSFEEGKNDDKEFCSLAYQHCAELLKNTCSSSFLLDDVQKLTSLYYLRDQAQKIRELSDILNGTAIAEFKQERLEKYLSSAENVSLTASHLKHISESMIEYREDLADRHNNKSKKVFSTGIPGLDKILGGGYEMGLHVIGARPKVGKTEFMVTLARHALIDCDRTVYIASLEMNDIQLIERFVSSTSKLSKSAIKDNFVDEFEPGIEREILYNTCDRIAKTNLYINDDPALTVQTIKSDCKSISAKSKIGLIMIDYLTMMKTDPNAYGRKDLDIADITRQLRSLYKIFHCPVVLLVQLNRDLEKRTDKRPRPSDSGESGKIEEVADSWIGLYRDSLYNAQSFWGNIVEANLINSRFSDVGPAYVELTKHGFTNVEEEKIERILTKESNQNRFTNKDL